MKKYWREEAFVQPLKKRTDFNLAALLSINNWQDSYWFTPATQDPASALKYMQKYVLKKKKQQTTKGKQPPQTKTWGSFKNELFVCPAPEAAEAAGLFQWEGLDRGMQGFHPPRDSQSTPGNGFAFPLLLLVLTHTVFPPTLGFFLFSFWHIYVSLW